MVIKPTPEETYFLNQRYNIFGNNLYAVPSLSTAKKIYLVDMVVEDVNIELILMDHPVYTSIFYGPPTSQIQ